MTNCMSESIGQLAKALSQVQAVLENVTKDQKGYNYKYANLTSCLEVIKQPFLENNLAISQIISTHEGEQVLITLLMHQSGEWLKSIFPLKHEVAKGMNDMQALGSAISYARRYALSSIVGIGQEDDDGASAKTNYTKPAVTPAVPVSIVPNDGQKLVSLCTNAMINPADFAKFHNIDSKQPATVAHAVKNFESLRYQWDNREIESDDNFLEDLR